MIRAFFMKKLQRNITISQYFSPTTQHIFSRKLIANIRTVSRIYTMRNVLFSILIIFFPIIALTLFVLGFYLGEISVSIAGLALAFVIVLLRKYTDYYHLRL